MALNILDLPVTSGGMRAYMVGSAELHVSTDGGRTRVERVSGGRRNAVEGFWLNDTEAIEAFYSEWML